MDSKYDVPLFETNGDIMNCSCYRAVKLLQHGMKVVEMVIEERLCRIVTVDEMRLGFMLLLCFIVDVNVIAAVLL